jgi:IS5 family transposase
VLLQEAEKGLVTDYHVHHGGNPPDQPMLKPALDKHKEIFGKDPKELAADRGFHLAGQDKRLQERGVRYVSIPVRGKPTGHRRRTEKSVWFRRLQRWRAAGEAKISLLRRKYGWRKTKTRGDIVNEIAIGGASSRTTSSCCRVSGHNLAKRRGVGNGKEKVEGNKVMGNSASQSHSLNHAFFTGN